MTALEKSDSVAIEGANKDVKEKLILLFDYYPDLALAEDLIEMALPGK